jgi:hypothetical protein
LQNPLQFFGNHYEKLILESIGRRDFDVGLSPCICGKRLLRRSSRVLPEYAGVLLVNRLR